MNKKKWFMAVSRKQCHVAVDYAYEIEAAGLQYYIWFKPLSAKRVSCVCHCLVKSMRVQGNSAAIMFILCRLFIKKTTFEGRRRLAK